MVTQAIIDKYSPSTIINFGSAGGFDGKTQALEYYNVDKCCQYDFDLSELDPVPIGYIQDYVACQCQIECIKISCGKFQHIIQLSAVNSCFVGQQMFYHIYLPFQ